MHKYAYNNPARYRYDPEKRLRNQCKHGYDFDDARLVIESERSITFEDRRFDYGEQRFITLGVLHGQVVVIATAETEDEIRIISMRKADSNEQEIYFRQA